jgi:hypothetical protein
VHVPDVLVAVSVRVERDVDAWVGGELLEDDLDFVGATGEHAPIGNSPNGACQAEHQTGVTYSVLGRPLGIAAAPRAGAS